MAADTENETAQKLFSTDSYFTMLLDAQTAGHIVSREGYASLLLYKYMGMQRTGVHVSCHGALPACMYM